MYLKILKVAYCVKANKEFCILDLNIFMMGKHYQMSFRPLVVFVILTV